MNEIDFFNNYIKNYDRRLKGIKLKYNHSFRVIEKAINIGNTLKLDKEDMETVRVCALFHDIARFEQYTKYKSFDDSKTFDHGDRGEEILKENGYTNSVVLNTVKYHNKLDIPKNLSDNDKLFLKIIRDADKLDIMEYQYNDCKTKNTVIPDYVKDYFINEKSIDRYVKFNPEGNLIGVLRMLAFIFDLNYKSSFKYIKDLDLINKKCDSIKKQGNTGIDEIRDICNKYVESRL